MATVKNCFKEFQRGRTSVFVKPRPGTPKTVTTKYNVIAEILSMSKDRVGHTLLELLGMVGVMADAFAHSRQHVQP